MIDWLCRASPVERTGCACQTEWGATRVDNINPPILNCFNNVLDIYFAAMCMSTGMIYLANPNTNIHTLPFLLFMLL